jgi:hypothetical protein
LASRTITGQARQDLVESQGLRGMDMNSPAVIPFAPSTRPALELIALAQLSPEQARQKLRALLLANPNYFGKVPSASFIAVLKIEEDTTYECISRVGYDGQCEQLCATVDIKQAFGYSSDALIHGSEEFVRFYLSYDGGSMWLDQGMRSVNAIDAHLPRSVVHEVRLQIIPADELCSERFQPRVRAILSWNSPPPAGAPNWTPVWGNVVESDIRIEDSQLDFPRTIESVVTTEFPKTSSYVMETETNGGILIRQRHLHSTVRRHSTKTDPRHRFLAFVLARVAGFYSSASTNSHSNGMEPVDRDGMATEFPLAGATEPAVSAVL